MRWERINGKNTVEFSHVGWLEERVDEQINGHINKLFWVDAFIAWMTSYWAAAKIRSSRNFGHFLVHPSSGVHTACEPENLQLLSEGSEGTWWFLKRNINLEFENIY